MEPRVHYSLLRSADEKPAEFFTRLQVISLTVAAIFCLLIWPPSATADDKSARPAAAANATDQELRDALRKIDCAALRIRTSADGTRVVSGTVPSDTERTKLVELGGRLAAPGQLSFDVGVLPRPLCGSLLALDRMSSSVLASEVGIEARLAGDGATLREGDPIRFEVKAGSYPVSLRVDYFSLDGQVLHMLPNRDQPAVMLAAGARRVFGASGGAGDSWNSGGAPFGTEFIAVTATPQALDLGQRPETELAAAYLRDLENALRTHQAGGRAPIVATTLLHTSEREAVAGKEQPAAKADPATSSARSEQLSTPPVPPPSVPAPEVLSPQAPAPAPAAATDRPAQAPAVAPAAPVPDQVKSGIRSKLFGPLGVSILNAAMIVVAAIAVVALLLRRREMAKLRGPNGTAAPRIGLLRRVMGSRGDQADIDAEGLLRWAGGNRVNLAIVFTDIVGSTALREDIKDRRMDALCDAHFAQSKRLIGEQGGYFIKTIGDSVMAAFRSVNNALDYACALQRDPGGAELPGGADLRIRAGIHVGPMSVEKDDVSGRTVNFAARVIGAIEGSEIWVSEQAKADIDGLGAHDHLVWQPHEDIEAKGFTGAITLWSLVADQALVSEPAEMRGSAG